MNRFAPTTRRLARAAAAGLLLPGGGLLDQGRVLPAWAALAATAGLARLGLLPALLAWLATWLAGILAARVAPRPAPSIAAVFLTATVLLAGVAALAGSAITLVGAAGQIANRCLLRACVFAAAQLLLLSLSAPTVLVLALGAIAAAEAVATALLEVRDDARLLAEDA